MGITIKVTSKINIPKVLKALDNPVFWMFAANEWHRLISPYTPFRTGNLDNNVTIWPKQIHYNMPYSGIVYNKNANFRKDQHPLASKEWDQAAIAAGQDESLIAAMQGYILSGRLKLK